MAYFAVEHRGSVALVTFTRPPRNTMSMAAMTELEGVLAGLATDASVHVVVLTGGVPGYFVAHADLDDLLRLAAANRSRAIRGAGRARSRCWTRCPSPSSRRSTVRPGAGAASCRWPARCGSPPRRPTSVSPRSWSASSRARAGPNDCPDLIGAGRAAELVLSGRVIQADEAERIGLVEAVLPDEGFVDAAVEWARRIADQPRHAVVAAKRALLDGMRGPAGRGPGDRGPLLPRVPDRGRDAVGAAGGGRPVPRRRRRRAPRSHLITRGPGPAPSRRRRAGRSRR